MYALIRFAAVAALCSSIVACAATVPKEEHDKVVTEKQVTTLKLEKTTQDLVDATDKLKAIRNNAEEVKRRFGVLCQDYPSHHMCSETLAAKEAKARFCSDKTFVKHVDAVVKACHQGACKQVDQAALLTRADYMRLVQRLPHSLVLFKSKKANIDADDRKQLQEFVESLQAQKGYMIIVGRASKDGIWKKNLTYALNRAEATREFIVGNLGVNKERVGFITYGHDKMYLTETDAKRLSDKQLSAKSANRSAFVFAYPCFEEAAAE